MSGRSATSPLTDEELRQLGNKSKEGFDGLKKLQCLSFREASESHRINLLLGTTHGPKVLENTSRYKKLVRKTEGFDAGHWTCDDLLTYGGMILSCPIIDGHVKLAADFAISTLNSQLAKEKEDCLCVEQVIRATVQAARGMFCYVTIKASDGNYYEAKVHHGIDNKFSTMFVRSAKHYPETDSEIRQLKMFEDEAGGSGSRR